MDKNNLNVLLIEDNPDDVILFEEMIHSLPPNLSYYNQINMNTRECISDSIKFIEEKSPLDIILLDLSLPDSIGYESLRKLRDTKVEVPIVIMTMLIDEETIAKSLQNGAQDYLIKGTINADLLLRTIRYSIDRYKWITVLRDLALLDELTGLYNRRGFITLAESHLRLAMRKEKQAILVYFDLDRLKSINDNFGHREGDRALVHAAKILRNTFRGSDIIARIGGDEFVVLALDVPKGKEALIQERLKKSLDEHHKAVYQYKISFSYGIAPFDTRSNISIDELLKEADSLMYENKKRTSDQD